MNFIKRGVTLMCILSVYVGKAQITDDTNSTLDKGTNTVRLIDNKGTIKYLQSKNGLTQIASTNSGSETTTTWQLGGTLEATTYITAASSKEFALNGLELITGPSTASTNASDRSSNGTGNGFTVLIRDENTGAIQKIQLSALLDVSTIYSKITQPSDATADVDISVPGLPVINATNQGRLFVYRNGIKLVNSTDFSATTVDPTTAATIVKILFSSITMKADDVIEIHYVR